MMKKTILAALALSLVAAPALAATVVNNDSEVRTLIVTEGSSKSELAVGAGESVDFCPSGCFVTMPNGDREALTGSETIEIKGGQARIR
jgi:opacity protein-like surface antigen